MWTWSSLVRTWPAVQKTSSWLKHVTMHLKVCLCFFFLKAAGVAEDIFAVVTVTKTMGRPLAVGDATKESTRRSLDMRSCCA